MTELVKVVVDCSGGGSTPPGVLDGLRAEVVDHMRSGDLDAAMSAADHLRALESASGNVAVVPLSDDELEQREADALVDVARQVEERRVERDRLLSASDWTQGTDSPLDGEMIEAWRDYRRELRDLDYRRADVSWPVPPS